MTSCLGASNPSRFLQLNFRLFRITRQENNCNFVVHHRSMIRFHSDFLDYILHSAGLDRIKIAVRDLRVLHESEDVNYKNNIKQKILTDTCKNNDIS